MTDQLDQVRVLLAKAVDALRRKGGEEKLWQDAAEACIAVEEALVILRREESN